SERTKLSTVRGVPSYSAPLAAGEDVVAAQGAAARGEEETQHLELLGRHLHRLPAAGDALRPEVHLDLAEPVPVGLAVVARHLAPQEGLHPCEQLAEPERLRQVVVGP